MSHRDTCPDRWTALREGERAFEWGRSRSSNPYDDPFRRETNCEEAADDWRAGYRRAEMRAEEEQQEEAARRRAERQRAELAAEDLLYFDEEGFS